MNELIPQGAVTSAALPTFDAIAAWGNPCGAETDLAALRVTGPGAVLRSRFDVTTLAAGSVAVATISAARLLAVRRDSAVPRVTVDTRAACAAFAAERLFTPIGWPRPQLWDPIAGNYRTSDSWIRLHTNYAYHREIVEHVLDGRDSDAIATAAASWKATELEAAIVDAGGCAAVMQNRETWLALAPGQATADARPIEVASRPATSGPTWASQRADQPLSGVRVLDLTRVIAGPDCTKFLAAWGADVLRIDPPNFAEVESLLPETTVGKRTAALDLTNHRHRGVFDQLLRDADVLVCGLRKDALARLGYDDHTLTAANPDLIVASLNAYGHDGPWRDHRGFDSLVQMSCGIAAAGAERLGLDEPWPLPVQALDHATGYLLAAAVTSALTRHLSDGTIDRLRASLVGTANLLWALPEPATQPSEPAPTDVTMEDTRTEWGPARRVPMPGSIAGTRSKWAVDAGRLGRHRPQWLHS